MLKATIIPFCVLIIANIAAADLHSQAHDIFFEYLMKTKKRIIYRLPLVNNELFVDAGSIEESFPSDIVATPWRNPRLNGFLHGDSAIFSGIYGVYNSISISEAAEKAGRQNFRHVKTKKDWHQLTFVSNGAEYAVTYTTKNGKLKFGEITIGSASQK